MDGPASESDAIDAYILKLQAAGVAALDELGGMIVDDLHQQLNTPYPPASEPSETPHRRTGRLAAGLEREVSREDQSQVLSVRSTRLGGDGSIPSYLERGTSRMAARPFIAPARAKWQEAGPPIIYRLMRESLG